MVIKNMELNEETFMIFAAKYYDTKHAASSDEFYDDLKRFQYLKRLFKRYEEDEDLRIRLILNHLIVLYNCFGLNATEMLFLKLDEYHQYLKPFLIFLNYMPEVIEYSGQKISTVVIPLDKKIVEELRKI